MNEKLIQPVEKSNQNENSLIMKTDQSQSLDMFKIWYIYGKKY